MEERLRGADPAVRMLRKRTTGQAEYDISITGAAVGTGTNTQNLSGGWPSCLPKLLSVRKLGFGHWPMVKGSRP